MFEMIDYMPATQDTEPQTESTTVMTPTVTIVDITRERQENPPKPYVNKIIESPGSIDSDK